MRSTYILDELHIVNLLRVIPHLLVGRPVFCFLSGANQKSMFSIGHWLGIREAHLAALPELVLTADSYDEPAREFVAVVEGWQSTRRWQRTASQWPGDQFDEEILRAGVLQQASDSYLPAATICTFVRTLGQPCVLFTRNTWLRLVLESMQQKLPALTVKRGWGFPKMRRLRRSLKLRRRKVFASILGGQHEEPAQKRTASPAESDGSKSGVAIFVNRGLEYGHLYRYEYLMREMDSDEPLWSDSVFISRDGGSFPAEVASCRRPQGNPTIFWTLKNVIRFLGLRRTSDVPKTVLKAMHIVMESATTFAQNFGTQFPAVKLAVFGYESQVPAAICLGLRSRGVLTVAVHERLASGVQRLNPFAVEVLLTGNDQDSVECLNSPALAVKKCLPVGLWRTDFFRRDVIAKRRRLTSEDVGEERRVVVLPYPYAPGDWGSSLALGRSAVSTFLLDVVRLAQSRPDTAFIIRSKQNSWLNAADMNDIHQSLREQHNVYLSEAYATQRESYALCEQADLVIAKHTSLVDECLAVGIPCLLHDYSLNYSHYAQHLLTYLPESCWVQSYEELERRVEAYLPQIPSENVEQGRPRNLVALDQWNDGKVIPRIRQQLMDLRFQ